MTIEITPAGIYLDGSLGERVGPFATRREAEEFLNWLKNFRKDVPCN